jgi:hypothetical protein
MSPRIHQVLRSDVAEYFMGDHACLRDSAIEAMYQK